MVVTPSFTGNLFVFLGFFLVNFVGRNQNKQDDIKIRGHEQEREVCSYYG